MLPTLPNALRALVLAALGQSATAAWADTFTMPPIAGDCSAATRQAEQRLEKRVTDKPYGSVRRLFLAAGWRPAPVQEMDRGRFLNTPGGPEDHLGGEEQLLSAMGYDEIDACAVDRGSPCIFRFKDKAGDRLRVNTIGELQLDANGKVVPGAQSMPRIIALQLTCPPSPPDVWVKVK